MADRDQKIAASEAVLLQCLFKGINESSAAGPSTQLVSPFTTPEQRLTKVVTPEFADFLITVNKKYQTEGGYVLDVACGRGNNAAVLIHNGLRVVSCDISDEMIRLAQECRESFVKGGYKGFDDWKIFKADMLKLEQAVSKTRDIPACYDTVNCYLSLMFLCSDDDLKNAFSNFANLLRPGGALIVDTRNFLYMAKTGKAIKNGHIPCCTDEYNRLTNIIPFPIYGPAPEHKPLAVFMDYQKWDGGSMYIVSRVFSREQITSVAKSTFGESCKITVLYDLKEETECEPEDASIITYIIEKPAA